MPMGEKRYTFTRILTVSVPVYQFVPPFGRLLGFPPSLIELYNPVAGLFDLLGMGVSNVTGGGPFCETFVTAEHQRFRFGIVLQFKQTLAQQALIGSGQ